MEWDPPHRFGVCSVCQGAGGNGRDDQLLLCDGQHCPISTHMKCLSRPLDEVGSSRPGRKWILSTVIAKPGGGILSLSVLFSICGSPDPTFG